MKNDLLAGGSVLAILGITTFLLNVLGVGWFSADVLMPVTAGAFGISAFLFYLSYRSAERCLNNLICARDVEQICQAVFLLDFGAETMEYLKFHIEQALKKPKEGDNTKRYWRVVVLVAALMNHTNKLSGGSERVAALKKWFLEMLDVAAARSSDSETAFQMVETAKLVLTGNLIKEEDAPGAFITASLSTRIAEGVIEFGK